MSDPCPYRDDPDATCECRDCMEAALERDGYPLRPGETIDQAWDRWNRGEA